MYVLEGTGDFVFKHRLQKGDYILLYWDLLNQSYVIRAVRAYEVEGCADKEAVTALGGNKADKALANDADIQNWPAPGGLEFEAFNPPDNFPKTEDNSYFSDILNQFSLWDELMTNHPATQPSISFDNLSSEDLSQV